MSAKETGIACDSCRRKTAKRVTLEGFTVDACQECLGREFNRGRILQRAKERANVGG